MTSIESLRLEYRAIRARSGVEPRVFDRACIAWLFSGLKHSEKFRPSPDQFIEAARAVCLEKANQS